MNFVATSSHRWNFEMTWSDGFGRCLQLSRGRLRPWHDGGSGRLRPWHDGSSGSFLLLRQVGGGEVEFRNGGFLSLRRSPLLLDVTGLPEKMAICQKKDLLKIKPGSFAG